MSSPFLHGPVEEGLCVICHESHSSSNLHLVRRGGEQCLTCHGPEIDQIRSMRHVHAPLEEGGCLACHNPHGGQTPALTHQPVPQICNVCHGDLDRQIASSRLVHGAVTEDEACSSCHAAHASPLANLLREGELDLCLSCHDKEVESSEGDWIPDVATLMRMSAFLHGPVRDGNCSSCHDSHASDTFRLLAFDYPPDFYAPFAVERYALCFQCHSQESFTAEQTQTRTNYRRGSLNLHFVHVTREQRGRTCRACHEVHASNLPFHMSASVPYGGWDLPINFEQLPDGGRCSPGCHEPREYHRTAVEITPLRESLAPSDETPTQE